MILSALSPRNYRSKTGKFSVAVAKLNAMMPAMGVMPPRGVTMVMVRGKGGSGANHHKKRSESQKPFHAVHSSMAENPLRRFRRGAHQNRNPHRRAGRALPVRQRTLKR